MHSSRRTTSDHEKPTVLVQPSRTEKVSRDVSPTVSPISARRRHAYEPVPLNVTLDTSLVDLSSALYEDLSLVLRKDGAWRKLLQTEDKVTRKMEMDASSYMEDFEHKPGKKALDILSEKGWTIQRLRNSFHQLGFMDCLDLLERVLGAEETTPINNGISVESLNAGLVSASSLSINSQQSVDSEGLGTETDSFSSDQMFGGGNGERIEATNDTVNFDNSHSETITKCFKCEIEMESIQNVSTSTSSNSLTLSDKYKFVEDDFISFTNDSEICDPEITEFTLIQLESDYELEEENFTLFEEEPQLASDCLDSSSDDDIDSKPLYEGSSVTTGALMLFLALFTSKHNITGDGIQQLLNIISLILPQS